MNNGLKNYTKQIRLTVGNAAETSININKEDANLHISLPLITTIGLNPIETILTFNLQDKDEIDLFGKGFKLNFFNKVTSSGTTIKVKNSDGTIDEYKSEDNYKNKETGLEVKKIDDDNYGAYHYEMKDKYGNITEFKTTQNYPKTISYKNGDKLTTDFVALTKYINNGKGDEIRFTKNGSDYITKVEYYHNNSLINGVDIAYDSNKFISKISYRNGNTIVGTSTFTFLDSEITIIDDLSGYRMKYDLSNNRVVSFIEGYDVKFTNGHKTTIEYNDRFTTLINYKGKKTYSFFDSDNLPTFEMNEENEIVETEFDKETKALKSNSGSISFNTLENLLDSTDISSFDNSGLTVTKVSQTDAKFKNIIGDSVYRLSGTGTLTKTISINGLASDNTLAVLFGKQLTPSTDKSYVEVSLSAGSTDTDKFDEIKVDNLFELMTLGTSATKSFDKVTLTIKLVGNAVIEIGGVKIAKKEFASFYNYDESGNTTQLSGGSKTTNMTYGSNNLPSSSIGIDSTMFNYEYDDYGNLIKAQTAYGSKIENKYDSTYKSNLISNKVTNKDGTKILETTREYMSDGRFVASSTDELGNKTTYDEYDAFGKIKKVTNALGAVSKFSYNSDDTLNKILLEKGTDSVSVSYSYDSKKRLSKVTLENGSIYDFVYDSLSNIKEIKLNGTLIFAYEYELSTGNLIKQTYGKNSDAYIFEYDDNNLISKIYYQPVNGSKLLKVKYSYDEKKRITKVENGNSYLLNSYEYDQEDRVKTVKTSNSEINNSYDNLGNINAKAFKVNEQKYYSSYDTVSRSKGSHPESIYAAFAKLNGYIGMFETDGNLVCSLYKESLLPIINHKDINANLVTKMDGVIPYISVNYANRLSYKLTNKDYSDPCGHISFWFKSNTTVSSTSKKYLFSVHTSFVGNHASLGQNVLFPGFIGVYLLGKRIYLEVIDDNNVHYDLIKSDYDVDLSKWNFVSLNFMNRYDGIGYPDLCEYALVVNAHRQTYKKQDPRLYVDINPEPVMNIGHKYDGKNSYEDFSGKITGLLIGRRTYFLNDIVNKFYRLTKDYLIDNQLVDNDAKIVDFSQTNLFSINQEIHNLFEIYPLQNNVVSLNGKRPIKFNIRNVSALDKDRTFNFNSINKRYSYVADGEELVYDFGISSLGTIAMRAYTDVNENKQYLFEGKDESGNVFGLFRNSNKSLVIDVNGSKLTTNLLFETNKWQSVSLSFKENISSSSQSSKYLDIRVTVDDKTWSASEAITFSYKKLDFMIGRSHKEVTIPMIFGSYKTTYPLYGQIEMIATRAAYCEASTLSSLVNELKGLTKVSEFDEFGMLKKVDIHECGNSILSNTYEYKKRSNNSKYISKQIKTEKIKVGSETYTRSYESDALGNITKITDSTFGSHSYEYDSRGFLIKADDETYSYDKNGNIVKKGDYTLTYDSSIKDRLVSFNGTKIEYDSSNPLNPRKYGSNTYQFEGRRLVRWLYGGGYYDYVYNDQGLRIKKTDYRGVTWDYIYDGNKLIREKSINNTLDFLYDEYDNLYGFIKDNSEKYLYIRDQLQNIIGITDINGEIVVKYSYDAWGALKNIEDTSSSGIGKLNPFRFKGYYYDNESSMYYCKTRYYVPQWGRWLSPDSIEYLNPESVNKLNLYTYANNNPVIYYDPDGHMALLCALLILGAIGMVANVGSQALTDLAYRNEFKWENYLVAAGAGFLGGMCYAIPGVGSIVSAAVTSGLTTAGQMIVSGEYYDGWDYLIMAGGSAILSGLTAWEFGKISNNLSFFKDSNFILDNFSKFATNYGGITLKSTVILQAAGQIAIRETIAGFVGAPLSGIPGYFDRVYRLNKQGLSPVDSFLYAF